LLKILLLFFSGFGAQPGNPYRQVSVVVPDNKDLNEQYDDALHVLQTKKPKEAKKVNLGQEQEDYYRNVRTKQGDFRVYPKRTCLLMAFLRKRTFGMGFVKLSCRFDHDCECECCDKGLFRATWHFCCMRRH
jgi:hypothetical protein